MENTRALRPPKEPMKEVDYQYIFTLGVQKFVNAVAEKIPKK